MTSELPAPRVRVFCATSLDGFIAGEGDDLSWLPPPDPSGDDGGFGALLAEVGALLMGRRTYDAVAGFGGPWPYGELPVLVATSRPLASAVPTVRAIGGDIHALIDEALRVAAGRDVYLDGGTLSRAALDAGRVDAVTVTVIPVVLGRGLPLFAGCRERRELRLVGTRRFGPGAVQLHYAVERPTR